MVLQQLAILPDVGLVAGRLRNLPVDAGQTTAYSYLGITPPSPNYLLEPTTLPPVDNSTSDRYWQRRYGVTHGIWGSADNVRGTQVIAVIPDHALDRVMSSIRTERRSGLGPWKLVRYPGACSRAWISRCVREADNWGVLYSELSTTNNPDVTWVLAEDKIRSLPEPTARIARLRSWDGQQAIVEHDGSCMLVMRRTYYPGWVYQIEKGPELPVLRVEGGLQGVRLLGAATSHVRVRYRPTGLWQAVATTLSALTAAIIVLAIPGLKNVLCSFRVRSVANSVSKQSS